MYSYTYMYICISHLYNFSFSPHLFESQDILNEEAVGIEPREKHILNDIFNPFLLEPTTVKITCSQLVKTKDIHNDMHSYCISYKRKPPLIKMSSAMAPPTHLSDSALTTGELTRYSLRASAPNFSTTVTGSG